jgi:hypothetical protein
VTHEEYARVLSKIPALDFRNEDLKEAIRAGMDFCDFLSFARGIPYRGPRSIYFREVGLKGGGRPWTRM